MAKRSQKHKRLRILLQVVSTENVFTLVSVVSYNEYSLLSSIYSSLNEVAKEIPWMCKIGIVDLKNVYKNLVAHWLVSDNSIRGMELVTEIVCNIYTVIYKGVSFDGWNKTRKDKDTSYAISEVLTVLARKNIIDVAYTEYIPTFLHTTHLMMSRLSLPIYMLSWRTPPCLY